MEDMMKYQSFTRVNKQFISKHKYSNNISLGAYITEKMLDMNIDTGYLYYTKHTPFYDIASKNKDFEISITNSENSSLWKSILYSKLNRTPGLILSTNNYLPQLNEYSNFKLILLSFDTQSKLDNGIDIFQECYILKYQKLCTMI